MSSISTKLIALLMALWLPLFSGGALAASVVMQTMNGNCTSASEQTAHHYSHHAATDEQNTAHVAQNDAGQGDHHDNPCSNNCGVCHIACCAYLATLDAGLGMLLPLSKSYASSQTRFQSITFAPLDPPPLVRA